MTRNREPQDGLEGRLAALPKIRAPRALESRIRLTMGIRRRTLPGPWAWAAMALLLLGPLFWKNPIRGTGGIPPSADRPAAAVIGSAAEAAGKSLEDLDRALVEEDRREDERLLRLCAGLATDPTQSGPFPLKPTPKEGP